MIVFETFGGVALFIGVGLLFFVVFARLIMRQGDGDSKYKDLSELYGLRQIGRGREKISLLEQIGGPECRDGTYSPRQNALWAKYYNIEREDKILTERERNELVEARGYLPDEIEDIIEGKR